MFWGVRRLDHTTDLLRRYIPKLSTMPNDAKQDKPFDLSNMCLLQSPNWKRIVVVVMIMLLLFLAEGYLEKLHEIVDICSA